MLVGSLSFDHLLEHAGDIRDSFLFGKVESLSVGFLIDRIVKNDGGTAGNIAYNLSLLSLSAEIIATAGHDADSYLERLKNRGVGINAIEVSDLPSATAYALTDSSENQITSFYPGACALPYTKEYPLSAAGLMVVSPTCLADMERFPREAQETGCTYFFDPGQQTPALSSEVLTQSIEGADTVFVNEYELGLLQEKTGLTEAHIAEKARLLIVTLGAGGSRLITKEGEELVPAVSAQVVDPTGAGDAYRAGFVSGYLKGLSDSVSAQLGSTLAAFAVEYVGCQNHSPSLEELQDRYQASYSEPWPL